MADSSSSSSSSAPVALGDEPLVPLTGDQVCAALAVDAATVAIGSEVAQAEPSAAQTPQCTYTYGGDSASLATFTVAAQRPVDVGGRGLQDAFDHVLEVNRDLAGGSDVEEAEVDAGDRAVRLTGSSLTLTVVAAAGHLLTILTTPDLDSAAVEALAWRPPGCRQRVSAAVQ